jgi:hypothetical protein
MPVIGIYSARQNIQRRDLSFCEILQEDILRARFFLALPHGARKSQAHLISLCANLKEQSGGECSTIQ